MNTTKALCIASAFVGSALVVFSIPIVDDASCITALTGSLILLAASCAWFYRVLATPVAATEQATTIVARRHEPTIRYRDALPTKTRALSKAR